MSTGPRAKAKEEDKALPAGKVFEWHRQVFRDPTLSLGTRTVAGVISTWIDGDKGSAWAWHSTLMAQTGMSIRGVQVAIAKLVKDGHLLVERPPGGHKANRYWPVIKGSFDPHPGAPAPAPQCTTNDFDPHPGAPAPAPQCTHRLLPTNNLPKIYHHHLDSAACVLLGRVGSILRLNLKPGHGRDTALRQIEAMLADGLTDPEIIVATEKARTRGTQSLAYVRTVAINNLESGNGLRGDAASLDEAPDAAYDDEPLAADPTAMPLISRLGRSFASAFADVTIERGPPLRFLAPTKQRRDFIRDIMGDHIREAYGVEDFDVALLSERPAA